MIYGVATACMLLVALKIYLQFHNTHIWYYFTANFIKKIRILNNRYKLHITKFIFLNTEK